MAWIHTALRNSWARNGDKLIRVRLGKKGCDGQALSRMRQPFTSVPYHVRAGKKEFVESTRAVAGFQVRLDQRPRGVPHESGSGDRPESGQGALGPALVTVGQGYEDYRSQPAFHRKMERFLEALLQHKVRFRFTQLWLTKAETLRMFVDECKDGSSWAGTWSCWPANAAR